jgi:hypothetical protein
MIIGISLFPRDEGGGLVEHLRQDRKDNRQQYDRGKHLD